jgi:large subunit ribosomal protein L9
MKVIFVQDLPNVAQVGDTKEVANGYARNFLIPKKLAVVAKPGAANIVASSRRDKTAAELAELAEKLEGLEINLKARVGTKDRLYGAVTTADIASELNRTAGVVIDKKKIALAKPIHQLGSYEVAIKLAKDIIPKINVILTEEETA